MKSCTSSIPQTPPVRKFDTVDSIVNGCCEHCGGPLTVDYAHLGGYPQYEAFVVYEHHFARCPIHHRYYLQHIPRSLADAYWDTVQAQDIAFGVWEQDQFEEAQA